MANRYWVGGSGTWDASSTTNWSLTSGGAAGASAPTTADFANFEANSGTAATVTVASTAVCGNMLINKSDINLSLSGNATLSNSTTGAVTLLTGAITLNNFTLSTSIFNSSGTSAKSIAFGTGNIDLTNNTGATCLGIATATNFTWTGTGGFTRNNATASSISFGSTAGGDATNAINFTVTGGSAALGISSTSHFKKLNFTGSTCSVVGAVAMYGNLTLASGGSYLTTFVPSFFGSGTFTSAGVGATIGNTTVNGAGITVTLGDNLSLTTASQFILTQGTIDLAGFTLSAGAFSSSNSNTRSIVFGAGNIDLTSTVAATTVLAMTTATGFTFTGTGGFTRNQAATATVVFGTTGGSTTNAPNLTVNAGASALTITSGSYFKNLNFTGSTCSVSGTTNMAGNLTLASGGTYTAVVPTFLASGTITSIAKTLGSTTINGTGITVTLGDALTLGSSSTLTLTAGTFTTANFNVTGASFSSSNSNTRTLNMGSSTWSITGSGTSAWNTATVTGLTLNAGTSTVSMTSAVVKTFAGGGLTYYNLNQGGGYLTIDGSNTFNNITNTVQPATIFFTAGTTQTVSNFGLSGTAGNLVTINSSTAGTQATISKLSSVANPLYLSIQDIKATGGAAWNAQYSTDAGNNTGWNFGNAFASLL